jgi:uncharacterized protein Smg (DUF494 family)
MRNNKKLSEIDMKNLASSGYTDTEINSAIGWIYNKFLTNEQVFTNIKPSKSFRVLNTAEQSLLESESHGYLIQLTELGLIDNSDLEIILDKIFNLGYSKLNLKEIKIILYSYLLENIFDENHRNNRSLNFNDSIN